MSISSVSELESSLVSLFMLHSPEGEDGERGGAIIRGRRFNNRGTAIIRGNTVKGITSIMPNH